MRRILFLFVRCIVAYNANSYPRHDSIIADSVDIYVEPEAPAILSCNIVSEHLTNFSWLFMDNPVIENDTLWWRNETHGTMELYIESVAPNDYGTYTCKATGFNYTIYHRIYLKEFPSDVAFDVKMLTPKSIRIKWEFVGPFKDEWNCLIIEYRESGTKQWLPRSILFEAETNELLDSLDIGALKPDTAYEVKGVITDKRWRNVRRIAFIKRVMTFVPRTIIPRGTKVVAELNERAVLSCDVTGEEITELTWQKIGSIYKRISTNVWSNSETDVTMELEIANATLDDNGFYECQARSSGQLLSASSLLEVLKFDHPPFKIRAIGTDRIYVIYNLTYFKGDQDNLSVVLTVKSKESSTNQWNLLGRDIDSYFESVAGSFVLGDFKNGTLHRIENVVRIYEGFDSLRETIVLSKWATTFEKDVEYVPTVEIVNKTMDTITIEWSPPPPELRESIDAYLILVMSGNDRDKYFRWQKFNATDGNEAAFHLQPSVSYDLQVQACFNNDCPKQHASVVMKGVMTNDTAGKEHLQARRESEFDNESPVLTIKVTRNSENTTAGSNASFTCRVSAQGYDGWWISINEMVTYFGDSDHEADWTIFVEDLENEQSCNYTCMAKMTNDSHTAGTMLVTLIHPVDFINEEAAIVFAKPLESTALLCDTFGYQVSNFNWLKISDHNVLDISGVSSTSSLNKTHTRMMLYFANTSKSDAGNYECSATTKFRSNIGLEVRLEVSDEPPLELRASVIGSKLVHLSWFDIESRGDRHLIRSSENGSLEWKDEFLVQVEGNKDYNGYVVRQLTRGTSYWFQIVVISEGRNLASTYSRWITQVGKDLPYFPNITVTLKTTNFITITWLTPPEELRAHIRVYRITVNSTSEESKTVDVLDNMQSSFTFEKLQPSTSYDLEVKACLRYVSTHCYSSDVRRGVSTKSIDGKSSTQVEIWLPLTGILFLLIGLAGSHLYKKARQRRVLRERLAYFYSENPISFIAELAISEQADLLPYEKKWEFPRKLLRLDDELGSGSFGIVWKARAKTIRRPEATSVVAVKTVRPTASLRCMKALLRELKILIYLGHHPNIVSLLGACTKDLDYGRLLVIVEFCRFGNLHDYLWRCRSKFVDELKADSQEISDSNFDADLIYVESHSTSLALRQEDAISIVENSCDTTVQPATSVGAEDSTIGGNSQLPEIEMPSKYPGDFANADLDPVCTRDLVSWAWQISRGMQYLADKKVLHGDLAARNVLLCEDNIVKICDFGLSKSLQDDDDYKDEGNDPLPVKWMAIESIRDGIFSVKSDVWSFGVVLWELFSLAKTPYPEINPASMCETLVGGHRMERPKYSPKSIYRTMRQCWDANPSKRPTFVELERSIGSLMEENVKTHYIELYVQRERVYAEITDYRKTRIPENQETIPPDPTESTNVSQDKTTEKSPCWMRLKRFFLRG